MNEDRLHRRIGRNAKRILKSSPASRERMLGTALVYDYGLGRLAGRAGAVPGLLVRTDLAWYFAATSERRDILYRFPNGLIRDMQMVSISSGTVLLVEMAPSSQELAMGMDTPTVFECLFGGHDGREAAALIGQAMGIDAGLLGADGTPTAQWRARTTRSDSLLRQTMAQYFRS